MATCAHCGKTVLFGGVRDGAQRFCGKRCHQTATTLQEGLSLVRALPEEMVERYVQEAWSGACPKCHGPGPVEAHVSYKVYSAGHFTRWWSAPQISCRSCAVKRRVGSAVYSLFLGWWGFPWGFIMTPVQIGRNIAAIIRPPKHTEPSALLRQLVRVELAKKLAAEQKAAAGPA